MKTFWTTEDVAAGRCGVGDVGFGRPDVVVLDPVLDRSPQAMRDVGIDTLMRLAQQRDAPRVALEAALALLDRSMGPVPLPVRPEQPALPALPEPEEQHPASSFQPAPDRLSYTDPEEAPPRPAMPPSSSDSEPPAPTPAASPSTPSRPAGMVEQRTPLRAVPRPSPSFWDGPGKPATGPTRSPT